MCSKRSGSWIPDAEIGLLYNCALVDPWVYAGYLKADAIHPEYRVALGCPGLIEGCREAGIAINAWTVNGPDTAPPFVGSQY